jgi:sarcosine/dimethylglycine N-methyltransferase
VDSVHKETDSMSKTIEPAYATGHARSDIERALTAAGKDPHALQPSELAMLEDFHSLGRLATAALMDLAQVGAGDRVLDAGTGIGGTARLIAAERGARVTAVDIMSEYCDVAEWLNEAVGLGDAIEVVTADVTELPFDDASFDVVFSQHVQMNVADKRRLYAEARRVLTVGGRLALWDVTAGSGGPPHFPVPWATSPEQSHLVTPDELAGLLREAGFEITHWNDLTGPGTAAMRDFFAGDRPPLGLHVFVPDFPVKAANLVRNLGENRARLIQAVVRAAKLQP